MLYSEYLTKRKQYQEEGRDLLLSKKHACLFFSPGKGKTFPVIEALQQIDKEKNGASVLIISGVKILQYKYLILLVSHRVCPKPVHRTLYICNYNKIIL